MGSDSIDSQERRMKPSMDYRIHREQARPIMALPHPRRARVSGSVARAGEQEGSYPSLPIDPPPETTQMDFGAVRHELRTQLRVDVDVLTLRTSRERLRLQVVSEAIPL